MVAHEVLFCPFCRESFEGLRECPEHELALVRFGQLPTAPWLDDQNEPFFEPDDAPLAALDPRFGRAWLALGAAFGALSMAVDVVTAEGVERGMSFAVALASAPSLGALPLLVFTLTFILVRRRTRRAVRSLRYLVRILAFLFPGVALHAFWRLRDLYPDVESLQPGAAFVALILAAALSTLLAGARLGR